MALHFTSSLSSFKPQDAATKSQLAQRPNSMKLSSIPSANKWRITQEKESSPRNLEDLHINHAEKLKVFKHALGNVGENSLKGFYMTDALQRLNIDHHFQEEIESFLQKQYEISSINGGNYDHDLDQTAFRFRLFRQQGYYVPADVFDKFTDKKGNFNQNLVKDMKGMVNLYEASHLGIAGEEILEEAEQFSGKVLKGQMEKLDLYKTKLVRSTLDQPFHKSLAIFTARNFSGDYHGMNGWLGALQELAKMDFSLMQFLHKNEILQISNWWTELGLANELKFARNQPLKWYVWSLACLTDPSLSEERVELTKPISFIYLLDDIFDVYGKLDELTLLTEAVTRWDINATEQLPQYMKICFKYLYDLTNQISLKVYQKHGWNPIDSLRKTWASLCKAFLVEAEWFASGKLPEAEEYLQNGIVSSGVHVVLVHIFFLLGEGITEEKVKIIDTIPGVISSSATILRLWDDLGSAEDEDQEGNDGSYVRCLMKGDQDISMERAREQVMSKISDAWKSLNQECLFENKFPLVFSKASLNLARMVPLMYNYDDNHSLTRLEEQVKSLLYDTVPL
ncbi:hypothetical protein L6164_036481 [Bauhinia variegata]|uniref:Uncharacterized protein n=1 Tax=Bauhinia variegata TaxID=167791 RepID=A0ACB9KHC0_BAUVA|nr:hypothetical protein L6164_036481 [Bauhinia variegata]